MPGRLILVLCAFLWSLAAAAQGYVVTAHTAPYAALSGPTIPVLTGTVDTGYAVVPLGFDFHYFGKTYANLTVTTDGMAYFEPNPGTSAYPSNVGFPSGSAPQGILAPFWDNLEGSNPFSRLGYQSGTGPHGQRLTVEWKDWNHWSATATYSLQFQLTFHESGLIEFHYGTSTGAGQALTASVGIESPTGTQGVTALGCTPACALADLAPDQVLSFGPGPNTRDLIAGKLVVDQVSESAGILTIQTTLEILNFGTLPVSAAGYELFLSADTSVDASDLPLQPAAKGPVSLGALGRVTHTTSSTVAKPGGGAWYVLARVDPSNAVVEASESNNVSSTATPLISGVDLVASAIASATAAAGPGEPVVNTIELGNLGIDAAGTVSWRILLSSDAVLDPADHLMHQGFVTLAGGQSVVMQTSYNIPSTVPSGDYWFVLQVDDVNQVPEISESNNVVFSQAKFTSKQADLALGPFVLLQDLYLGEPFKVEVPITNVGGATAKQFSVVAFVSDNPTLNASSDPEAGEVSGLSLAPGATTTVVLEGTVPLTAPNGASLVPGPYFVFLAAVSNANFVEISQENNVVKAGPLPISAPGPDLVATGLSVPSTWAPGELVPVSRVLRNLGNRPSPTFAYRYFLSKNALVTTQDTPLPIVGANGAEVSSGQASVAMGGSESRVEWIRVPDGVVPGEYSVGVFVDPEDAVVEIDEDNNGFTGAGVKVVPVRFQLVVQELPDAIVGLPWSFQLSAVGAAGPITWSVAPTAAGALPDEIALDPNTGRLQGTVAAVGLYPFQVLATDATGAKAAAVQVLRVLPRTGAVSITTSRLRAAAVERPYLVTFAAQGGQGPYRWSVIAGSLPAGMSLTEEGTLSGAPQAAIGTQSVFTVRVIDAVGNAAQAAFTLSVVAPGTLTVDHPAVWHVQVGSDAAVDLVATLAGDPAAEAPLSWAVIGGRLPPGLRLDEAGDAVRILRGVPTEAGTFPLAIEVVDAHDRHHTFEWVVKVHPLLRRIESSAPAAIRPGGEVSGLLTFEGGGAGRFKLQSGLLPPGVTLSEDGVVSGRVPEDAQNHIYTFTVTGVAQDGADGVVSLSLEVTDQLAAATSGCGCAAAEGVPTFAMLVLMWIGARVGRRRSHAAGR